MASVSIRLTMLACLAALLAPAADALAVGGTGDCVAANTGGHVTVTLANCIQTEVVRADAGRGDCVAASTGGHVWVTLANCLPAAAAEPQAASEPCIDVQPPYVSVNCLAVHSQAGGGCISTQGTQGTVTLAYCMPTAAVQPEAAAGCILRYCPPPVAVQSPAGGNCIATRGTHITITLANCIRADLAPDPSTAAASGRCIATSDEPHVTVTLAECLRVDLSPDAWAAAANPGMGGECGYVDTWGNVRFSLANCVSPMIPRAQVASEPCVDVRPPYVAVNPDECLPVYAQAGGNCVSTSGTHITIILANCIRADLLAPDASAAARTTDYDCVSANSELHIAITLENCVRT